MNILIRLIYDVWFKHIHVPSELQIKAFYNYSFFSKTDVVKMN
jgi:hypothetical protein